MVTCKYCNKQFNKITNTHLKSHNSTPKQYLEEFPGAVMMTEDVRKSYTAHLVGRTYEDIYGIEIAKALKEKRSIDALRQYEDLDQRTLRSKNRYKGYEELSGTRWSSYQVGAQRRGFEFNITIEYAWELFLNQERRCALSGVPIDFDMSLDNLRKTGHQGGLASLDRIDSKQGYIGGNIQWIHKDVNKMKMDLPQERFLEIVKQISKYKQL